VLEHMILQRLGVAKTAVSKLPEQTLQDASSSTVPHRQRRDLPLGGDGWTIQPSRRPKTQRRESGGWDRE